MRTIQRPAVMPALAILKTAKRLQDALLCTSFSVATSFLLTASENSFATPFTITNPLIIEQAVRIALRDNPDVLLARLGVYTAQTAVQTAGVSPNPTLTLGVSAINPSVGVGAGNLRSKTVDSSVRIDQLIERGGKKSLRVQNAAALSEAAEQDALETRRLLAIAVRQAFYDLLGAQQRVAITAESAALGDATMGAARKRERAGDLAPSDVTRLQVDALRSQNDLTQASADRARARLILLQLLGHGEVSDTVTASDAWPQPDRAAEQNIEGMLAQRADVRAAMARLDAAMAASRLALAVRTRDISLGVQYDHYPASAVNNQGGGNTFGVAIQIPLFVGNHFDGEIRSAALAADSARETLNKTRNAARNEVVRLLADRGSAVERLTRFDEQLLPAAKKSADAAEFAFVHGAIPIMDVLDVRRTYRQTLLDALAARVDHAKAVSSFAPVPAYGEVP